MNRILRSLTLKYRSQLIVLATMFFCILTVSYINLSSLQQVFAIENIPEMLHITRVADTSATLSNSALTPLCPELAQEAEEGELSGFFRIGPSGQFIHVPQGKGNRFSGIDVQQKASYCISVPVSGVYRIKALVSAYGASNDSMYVQVNGLPRHGFHWHMENSADFTENFVSDLFTSQDVEIELAAGNHLVEFFLREDGVRLDKFEFEWVAAKNSSVIVSAASIPETPNSIIGYITADAGDPWLPRNVEPQVANISIAITDAATNGQVYNQTTYSDIDGMFHVEDLVSRDYAVRLVPPVEHRLMGPEIVYVHLANDEQAVISFDLLVEDILARDVAEEDGSEQQSLSEHDMPPEYADKDSRPGIENQQFLPVIR